MMWHALQNISPVGIVSNKHHSETLFLAPTSPLYPPLSLCQTSGYTHNQQ